MRITSLSTHDLFGAIERSSSDMRFIQASSNARAAGQGARN
jgi:hypothetical protein